jgi:hypothetical protein
MTSLVEGVFVIFFNRQCQQFSHIVKALIQIIDSFDHLFEGHTLFTQGLCPFRVIPDIGAFQLADDFF